MERPAVLTINPVHKDSRGSIFDILEGKKIRHVGLITSRKGAVRGNHYHKKSTQYTFILKGTVRFFRKDLRAKAGEIVSFVLRPGDLAIDPPRVAHAVVDLEDCEFLDLTDVSREDDGYEYDTVPCQITRRPRPKRGRARRRPL